MSLSLLREDVRLPLLALREAALDHNIRAMARWCDKNGFLLAPHGKTTMCPRIHRRQLDAGAWAITVASAGQAAVCADHGVPRIFIANQLVGRANVATVAKLLAANARRAIYALVDSVDGVNQLAGHLKAAGAVRPLDVLVESGTKGGRTGVRSRQEGWAVHAAVLRHPGTLRFAGVEGFEGIVTDLPAAAAFLRDLIGLAEDLAGKDPRPAQPLLLSAGGTAYLDAVKEGLKPLGGCFRLLVRSGCYVTHDHGAYAEQLVRARRRVRDLPVFQPALQVWSYVQSIRDGQTAILNFGRRECSYDAGMPVPLFALAPKASLGAARSLAKARIVRLNDHHAFMALPKNIRLRVGDRVACGISHPCTTFEKWREIALVDDRYRILDSYRTFF